MSAAATPAAVSAIATACAPTAAPAAAPAARAADEALLERVFEAVHATRMADVPILNERLRVAALGFRDWQGVRVGALVTPWSINLVILPGPAAPAGQAAGDAVLARLRGGEAQRWLFPSGEYEFHGHEEATLGRYQQCSLFSPVLEFATHEDACAAARAALEALFTASQPAAPPPAATLSRRALLFGG